MSQLTHLCFKIFPGGTAFDVIFIDSPIFNRNVVNGVMKMIWWKYSITTAYSIKGGIDTTEFASKNHWSMEMYTWIHSQLSSSSK
jgi:hypothetical protein